LPASLAAFTGLGAETGELWDSFPVVWRIATCRPSPSLGAPPPRKRRQAPKKMHIPAIVTIPPTYQIAGKGFFSRWPNSMGQ
jgi:hypothetical protein